MTDNQKAQIINLRAAGNGYGRIAQTLGISLNTVKSFCRRNDINGNKVPEPSVVLTGETTCCENCGREIQQIAKRKKRRFCCDKCRNAWWNSHLDQVSARRFMISDARIAAWVHIYGDKRRKYCSHECYIADRFKGGGCDE